MLLPANVSASVSGRMRGGVRTGSEKRDTRFRGTGRVAWVARCTGELRPRNPPLGRRANRRGLLSCRLALRTPAPPHVAFFRALRTSTSTQEHGSKLAHHRHRQRQRQRSASASAPASANSGRMRGGVRTGSEKRDTRFRGTGRVAWVARCTGELRPRNPPLGRRANRRGLLSCRLALRTPAPPHVAFFEPSVRQLAPRSTDRDGQRGWTQPRITFRRTTVSAPAPASATGSASVQ